MDKGVFKLYQENNLGYEKAQTYLLMDLVRIARNRILEH